MGLGILCLETYWSADRDDRRSVRGLLEILEHNVPDLTAVHRHVASRQDFDYYMTTDWRDKRYDVLYVAAHGDKGSLKDEDGNRMSLSWLGKRLEGSKGRVVFLAGCATLDVPKPSLETFAEKTNAAAIVGYTRTVDWLQSAQMDLIVLGALAEHPPGATGIWSRSPAETLAELSGDHAGFVKRLGWSSVVGRGDNAGWRTARRLHPDGESLAADHLGGIAKDESVKPEIRERAVLALGVLHRGTEITSIARDASAPLGLRKAAVRAINRAPGGSADDSLSRLMKRLARDPQSDPNAASVSKTVRSALRGRRR